MNKLLIIALVLLSIPCFAKGRWYNATTLTGGGEDTLDGINGQDLFDNARAMVFGTGVVRFYYLDEDSGAGESVPDVIKPDDNAGTKRWILIQSAVVTPSVGIGNPAGVGIGNPASVGIGFHE